MTWGRYEILTVMNKKILQFAVAGLVSGVLSSWLPGYLPDDGQFTPGIVFGLITGGVLIFFNKNITFVISRFIGWVFVSAVSYYAAFNIALSTLEKIGDLGAFLIAGGLGSALLATGLYFIFCRFSVPVYVSFTLLGALLGMLGHADLITTNGEFHAFLFPILFIVWQAGIAGMIGYIVDGEKQEA